MTVSTQPWVTAAQSHGFVLTIQPQLSPHNHVSAQIEIPPAQDEHSLIQVDLEAIYVPADELNDAAYLYSDSEYCVLSERITPRIAGRLRERGHMWIDSHGDMFVRSNGVYVDVRATPKPQRRTASRSTSTLFSASRSQVVCMLLNDPTLVNESVRTIAHVCGVGNGTVQQTLQLLCDSNYLVKAGTTYVDFKVASLLEAWAHAYPSGLGPSLVLIRGTLSEGTKPDSFFNALPSETLSVLASGEQAVPHLIAGGNTIDCYIKDPEALPDILRATKLRKDNNGPVTIRKQFWQASKRPRASHGLSADHKVPLPLIFADLINNQDPRVIETAAQIKKEILDHAATQ